MKRELRGHIAQGATVRAAQVLCGLGSIIALMCRSDWFFILLFAAWFFNQAMPPPQKHLDKYTGRGN